MFVVKFESLRRDPTWPVGILCRKSQPPPGLILTDATNGFVVPPAPWSKRRHRSHPPNLRSRIPIWKEDQNEKLHLQKGERG